MPPSTRSKKKALMTEEQIQQEERFERIEDLLGRLDARMEHSEQGRTRTSDVEDLPEGGT